MAGLSGGGGGFKSEGSKVLGATSTDFSGLNGAKYIIMKWDMASLTTTDHYLIQLGDAGGIEAAGYGGRMTYGGIFNTPLGFPSYGGLGAFLSSGLFIISLVDDASNLWDCCGYALGTGPDRTISSGRKALSGPLDRVRITSTGGTFDTGNASLMWSK